MTQVTPSLGEIAGTGERVEIPRNRRAETTCSHGPPQGADSGQLLKFVGETHSVCPPRPGRALPMWWDTQQPAHLRTMWVPLRWVALMVVLMASVRKPLGEHFRSR